MAFDKNEFKIALLRADKTMIKFCEEHGFTYVYFNQSVNGQMAMKPEYEEAINNFLSLTRTT